MQPHQKEFAHLSSKTFLISYYINDSLLFWQKAEQVIILAYETQSRESQQR
jgi:hypothetical protein